MQTSRLQYTFLCYLPTTPPYPPHSPHHPAPPTAPPQSTAHTCSRVRCSCSQTASSPPPKQQVFGASVVVFVRVLFRVMPRHPVADHLAHDAGVRGHGVPIGFVVELAILEACLLGAGDAFESVGGFRLLGKVVCLVAPFLTHDFGKGIESGNSPSFLFPLFFSCCR